MPSPLQANYEVAVGRVQVRALERGGDELLTRVEGALGPAFRHLVRVTEQRLDLTPAVCREIEQSITAARDLIDVHGK